MEDLNRPPGTLLVRCNPAGQAELWGHITCKSAQQSEDGWLPLGQVAIACSLSHGRNVVPSLGRVLTSSLGLLVPELQIQTVNDQLERKITCNAIIFFTSLGRLPSTCLHFFQKELPLFQYSIYHHAWVYAQDVFVLRMSYNSFHNQQELWNKC